MRSKFKCGLQSSQTVPWLEKGRPFRSAIQIARITAAFAVCTAPAVRLPPGIQ